MNYISLEDLKKLPPDQLKTRWFNAKFPYDAATCGTCMTAHHRNFLGRCSEPQHEKLKDTITFAIEFNVSREYLVDHVEEMYALRLYLKEFYINNPPEIKAITTQEIDNILIAR